MKSVLIFLLLFSLTVRSAYCSVEVPSSLEEISNDLISDVVVGEVLGIKRPPETADWEYQVRVKEVLKGNLKKGEFTATVHYQSLPGISIKTPRSGLESQMQVGKSYLFMLGRHEPDATRIRLIRSELLDQREAVMKKFTSAPPELKC